MRIQGSRAPFFIFGGIITPFGLLARQPVMIAIGAFALLLGLVALFLPPGRPPVFLMIGAIIIAMGYSTPYFLAFAGVGSLLIVAQIISIFLSR